MDIFNNSPKLQDIVSARLKQYKKEKKSPYRYEDADGYFTIYLPGVKKRSFDIKDNLPYQGDWYLFLEWLGDTSCDLSEARKVFNANTIMCGQYKNNKLMRTECRGIVDLLRTKLLTPIGKPVPDSDKEFQYAQSLISKYGLDKTKQVVSRTVHDEYWGKDFHSLGFFFKKAGDSNIFERILKSIT